MKFSVLIPIYAGEKAENFEECIESIINQTKKPNEILIIKDGPLTESLERTIENKIEENKEIEIRTHQIEKNVGVGIASNIGTKLCKYNYIARIDSDDISVKDRFEKQINYLKENPDVDILGGYIEEYDENMEKLISIRKVPLEDTEIKTDMKSRCAFNHSTVIYKKDRIIEAGNYSNRRIMEDYDLWIRCTKKGYKMHNLPIVLTKNRTGNAMYYKRGGINYAQIIIEIQEQLYSLKMINIFRKWYNIFIRTLVALMPLNMRRFVYINLLRK